MVNVKYGNLPFDEAIKFFQNKGYAISPESWRDVWQAAHAKAFTVARVTQMDVLMDIREEAQKALDEGISLGQFKKDLRKTLERKGWFAPTGEDAIVTLPDGTVRKRLTPWRLETIYRTNLQTAYSTGRHKQMVEVKAHRPYWQYMAIMDAATRPSHAAMHGKVFHADNPIWSRWYPPNGFSCRCYVKTLSSRQMESRKLREETHVTGIEPDEGWRHNPAKEPWEPDLSKYPQELREQYAVGRDQRSEIRDQ